MFVLLLLFVTFVPTLVALPAYEVFTPWIVEYPVKQPLEARLPDKSCNITSYVTPDNIRDFENCTYINGYIAIFQNAASMDLKLLNLMQNVRSVADYVVIFLDQDLYPDYPGPKSMSFLRNLEVIEGRTQYSDADVSLMILGSSLESLDLVNLKEIRRGKILVANNFELCYSHYIPFWQIAKDGYVNTKHPFKDSYLCALANKVCHSSCVQELGCWGPGRDKCYAVRNFKLDEVFVQGCFAEQNLFQLSKTECGRCSSECNYGCHGLGADECVECKNYKKNNTCVAHCSNHSYADAQKVCQPCTSTCSKDRSGCTGPSNIIGDGGCNRCSYAILFPNQTIVCVTDDTLFLDECVISGHEEMRHKFYFEKPKTDYEISKVDFMFCKPCDPSCQTCALYGVLEGDLEGKCP